MKAIVEKRSIVLNRRKTSISLEDEFWRALRDVADQESKSVALLVEQIDRERDNRNLSSAVRVFLLEYFRTHGIQDGLLSDRPSIVGISQTTS